MKVTKAEIATDGTIRAWVKLSDPQGRPLDRLGIQTPGVVSVSFLIAYIPADGTQYVSYITRQRTSGGNTATQATGENNGTWQQLADGEYLYTFSNKAPSSIDRNSTHTLGIYGSRNLNEFELGVSRDDDNFNFVPSGARVTKVRDVVRTSSCNKCHDQLAFHGGNRRSVEGCNLCHTPQSTDPASGNTIDMKVMVHKIHMGRNLPSVVAKGKYFIGNADYSEIGNPSPVMACTVCHEAEKVSGATQADNWLTKSSRETCGSCHDSVNFTTGANHAAGPQVSDGQCGTCHTAKGERDFDASIMGAHVVPTESSLLEGVRFKIESVEDVAPGKKPVVTFTVKDKQGNPILLSQMTNTRIYMAGPTTDFPSYVREDALRSPSAGDGRYIYTFNAAIPADAQGSFQFGIEGYRNVNLLAGTTKARTVRDIGPNQVVTVSTDGGAAQPRRTTVSNEKCNQCHYSLSFHGGNRNKVEMCTFCHNASLTEGDEKVSFNFVNMIHRAHAEEVGYPGTLSNCSQCHVGDSQALPLASGLQTVINGLAPTNPTPPTANACLSCHNDLQAWQHARANTTSLGESCVVCHGKTAEFSVSKMHAQ
jgi:OmcA/MtrC family decaheme c-type cytochrome